MSLIWACDEKHCNTTVRSYARPDGWESDPIYDPVFKKFEGMRHTCPKCAEKKRQSSDLVNT